MMAAPLPFGDPLFATPVARVDPRDALRAQQCGRHRPDDAYTLPAIPDVRGERLVILNAETTGLQWWAGDRPIGWAFQFPESERRGYLPIRHRIGPNHDIDQVRAWLRDLGASCEIRNVNTKFDLHMARVDGVDLQDAHALGDVAHLAALLDDERHRFNLDGLSADFLQWKVEDDPLGKIPSMIAHEGEFQFLHPGIVAPYAERNVAQVDALYRALLPRIADEDLGRVFALESAIIPVVVEMEKQGTYLDMDLLHRWHGEVTAAIGDLLWRIYRETGVPIASPDTTKDVEAVLRARGVRSTTTTATGRPSYTDGVLADIPDPVVQMLRTAGHLTDLDAKFLSKFTKAARSDGWLRFNLHQMRSTRGETDAVGTVSGRFSAAGDAFGGYNPQQVVAVEKQLERGWCTDYVVRKLFRPREPGARYVASDMKQVEYRRFAHYAGDAAILDAFARDPNVDFHHIVLDLLLPVNPSLTRKIVKNVNFAKIYGAGKLKFAFMIGLLTEAQYKIFAARQAQKDWSVFDEPELKEANAINAAYDRMFPSVKPLLDKASRLAETRGYVKTILGRRARLTGRFHSALNRIIQGTAAEDHKTALVEVYRQRKALGLTMRLTVHDEIVGDLAPGAPAAPLAALLDAPKLPSKVPILWETKVGATWADCK